MVDAKVDVTELMGNEIFVYLLVGETQFVARVDPRTTARMGDRAQLIFNMNNMHLFDPNTERVYSLKNFVFPQSPRKFTSLVSEQNAHTKAARPA